MASIKFLNNITLVGNQLELARIQNLGSAPTAYGDGQLYYDTGLNKLRLRENGQWVSIQSGTDSNTTYTLGVPASSTTIRLTGSDSSTSDIALSAGSNITLTRVSATEISIAASDAQQGTVTSVSGGTGITITGNASITPTVNIDYAGTDNAILAATAATPAGADTLWFSDATDNTIKKALISAMPGFGADGTVTSVATSNGTFVDVSGGTITTTGTITADLSATGSPGATTFLRGDNVWATPAGAYTDWKLVGDGGTAVDIGDGETVNFIGGAGLDATAASGSPNTLTLSLDLNELSTVTPVASDFVAIVDATDNSTKKALISGLPFSNNQGTVTSVGLSMPSAFSVANSPVTTSGTLTVTGAGTTSQVVLGDGSLGTYHVGDVTAVNAGSGISVTNSGGPTPTVSVDYSATGIIFDATGMSGSAESDDEIILADDSASGAVRKAALSDIPLNVLGSATGNVSLGSNKIISLSNPTNAQDAATKAYVDNQLAGSGLLIFQGGYNAATNTPDLDSSPSSSIKKGWSYVVTADGSFFSEQVRVGDLLIAEQDAPTTLAHWTTVQNNIDLASTTNVGIASFSSDNFAVSAAGQVTIKNGGVILGTETTGSYNPTVGTDTDINIGNNGASGIAVINTVSLTDGVITAFTTENAQSASETQEGIIELATQAEVDGGTNSTHAVTPATLASHISNKQSFADTYPASSTTSWSVAHGLGTADVIVQVYEVSSGATVYVDVVRDTSSPFSLTLSTATAQAANSLRVLVTKVG